MLTRNIVGALVVVASATAYAQSPNTNPAFRPGANHHIGDDAFRERYHREPVIGDEALRMHEHFLAAKALLSSRPATKPELEGRRKEILAAFDDYIAKGTTPKNAHLPWRTPVFIDDEGTICAVGYLIERTVGRSVAEKVAATHRYSYLEEIAGAMPEVASWVATSGFTLEELSTIQPGYMGPAVAYDSGWNLAHTRTKKEAEEADPRDIVPGDGMYDQDHVHGLIAKRKMEGEWTVGDDKGHILGKGNFKHGNAAWTSFYDDGKKLAEGKYTNSAANGPWKFYHPSGNLAAEGSLENGVRAGTWKFFYDDAKHTVISTGGFSHGFTSGTWKHYDADGKLLATQTSSMDGWQSADMFLLDIAPGADKVHHRIHEGDWGGDHHRLDELQYGNGEEKLFIQYHNEKLYDAGGNELVKKDGHWISEDCGWEKPMKKAARANNLSRLHALIQHLEDEHACAAPVAVPEARGKKLDIMVASFTSVRSLSPDFIRNLALGKETVDDGDDHVKEANAEEKAQRDDFAKTLAGSLLWYVEYPHVDGMFSNVYATMAGERVTGGN